MANDTRRARATAAVALLLVLLAAIAWKGWDVLVASPRRVAEARIVAFGVEPVDVPAPPLDLAAADGSTFSLGQAKGQVVFVNFFATWCPPCREEMPGMVALGQALAARHPGKFRMVAVSVDEAWEPVREYFASPPFFGVERTGLTVVRDPDQAATRAYYCTARGGACPDLKFPETYIVDARGRLVAYIVGPRDWSDPAASALLERIIGS